MEPLHGQGAICKWGTTEFHITSFSFENSVGNDIDITSMSSTVSVDPDNTDRHFIAQDFDACFSGQGGGEFKIDFIWAQATVTIDPWSCVGFKRTLDVKAGVSSTGTNFSFLTTAILSNIVMSASTGDYLKGSAVFKLCSP